MPLCSRYCTQGIADVPSKCLREFVMCLPIQAKHLVTTQIVRRSPLSLTPHPLSECDVQTRCTREGAWVCAGRTVVMKS